MKSNKGVRGVELGQLHDRDSARADYLAAQKDRVRVRRETAARVRAYRLLRKASS